MGCFLNDCEKIIVGISAQGRKLVLIQKLVVSFNCKLRD